MGWPGGGFAGHVILIAGTTKSGVEFFRWTQRFCFNLVTNVRTNGWDFAQKNGEQAQAKASDYRVVFFLI